MFLLRPQRYANVCRRLLDSLVFGAKQLIPSNATRTSASESISIPQYLLNRTIPAEEVLKNLTSEDSQRLKLLEAEHRLMLDSGQMVPSKLEPKMLLDLLCCASYNARIRYHEFLFKREKRREHQAIKKANKLHEPQMPLMLARQMPEPDLPAAGSDRILRVLDPKNSRLHDDAWIWAEMRCPEAAQQLVFDFSHESEMRLQDQRNLASQMAYVLQTTRAMRPHPFHIWLCGLKAGTNQYSFMEHELGVKYKESKIRSLHEIPWTISPNHYSEDFPLCDPDRPVIYLSPNAHRTFEPGEFDHNAVYVIGAIVDKAIRRPVTFAKARRAGVECVRLPLERYFKWVSGSSKTLTVNCIYAVLATAKSTNGDWETALRTHVPKRLYAHEGVPKPKLNRLFAMV